MITRSEPRKTVQVLMRWGITSKRTPEVSLPIGAVTFGFAIIASRSDARPDAMGFVLPTHHPTLCNSCPLGAVNPSPTN